MKRRLRIGNPGEEKCWGKRATYVCLGVVAVAVVAGVAVAVTLAATRSSARRENLIAYLNGQADGSNAGGWLDGWTAAEAHYAEHGIAELIEELARESMV